MNRINYPLSFEPLLQENIWGGEYLKKRSTRVPTGTVGESWEISDYKDETTLIRNGEHQGKPLNAIIEQIYAPTKSPVRFPLLLKILAPESELSVQVHPTDEYASHLALEDSGKAESWYILDAPENSFLYLGLTEKLDKARIEQAINAKTLTQYLNKVYVKKGDVVNIPHGTIHSLCPHIKVFEIQQSSNITYRLYDWGRVDKNGKSRELHIKEALEVINFDYLPTSHLVEPKIIHTGDYLHEEYVRNHNFGMAKFSRMTDDLVINNSDMTIKILSSLNSTLEVCTDGGQITLNSFDSCLIPAYSGDIRVTGNEHAEFLLFNE